MNIDELKKFEQLKEDIRKEVEGEIINKVKVNDSYFYAEVILSKLPLSMENPYTEQYGIKAILNLHNSQDFNYPHMTNEKREVKSKRIVLKETLDLDSVGDTSDPNVLMPIFYEMLAKHLAKEMIIQLSHNWHQYVYNPYNPTLSMKG